jgi:hypothetical protein
MGLIKEPLGVDFVVDPKSLTREEKDAISQYIRKYKAKKKDAKKKSSIRKKSKQSA